MSTAALPTPLSLDRPHNPWPVALTVTMATFMEVLDTSIANVALPHIAGSLSAGQDESTWVLTSYLVSNAIVLPLSGWLSSVIGRKRFYMGCVALFTISSMLCGMAPSLGWLIFFRVLQGMGGGGLQPSEQSILADTFPPHKRGMAFAVYGIAVVVAPAMGPTLGGWITDNYDWRWIFFINVPVGIVSLLLTARLVHDPPAMKEQVRRARREGVKIDLTGLGLIALGLGTLQVVLDKGQREDWFESKFIIVFSIVCVASLVLAVVWELCVTRNPIVDLRLLGERNFALANLLLFLVGFVLMGSTVLLPQFLQTMMGYTAMLAGWALTPGAFVVMGLMPFIGLALGRTQAKYLVVIGCLLGFGGLIRMSHFNLDIDMHAAITARVVQAAGLAFLFAPINTMAYVFLPPGKNNSASGLINLARNIGGSVGIAFVTTMLARQAQVHQTYLVAHATPYDVAYRSAVNGAAATLGGNAPALSSVYGRVVQQANMLAFVDNFRLMALMMLSLIPLVLLLKRTPVGKAHMGH